MSESTRKRSKKRQENPFLNLFFNILLPVLILNKFSDKNPTLILILALLFPVLYGLYDYFKDGHKNWVSVLGFFNILATGALALTDVEGIWFAVKEGLFPLVIAILAIGSAYANRTAIEMLFFQTGVVDEELIRRAATDAGRVDELKTHLRKSTMLLASSFFISAVLNFIIGSTIFVDIDPSLAAEQRQIILNKQISDMTWMGYVFIALPLMFFMAFIMWYLQKGITQITNLSLENIFPAMKKEDAPQS